METVIPRYTVAMRNYKRTRPCPAFPNTLLEAWSYGIPSVSAVNPGGVIHRHGIGETAENLEEMARAVTALMAAPDRRRTLGANARLYVERHHGADQTIEPLVALLDKLIEQGKQNGRL